MISENYNNHGTVTGHHRYVKKEPAVIDIHSMGTYSLSIISSR